MAKIKPDEKSLRELMDAVEADAPARLEPFLKAGMTADQKVAGAGGITLLGLAIEKNAIRVAKSLIAAGAKLKAGPDKPLIRAALLNRKEIVQLLLEAGANPNVTVSNPDEDVRGETALMHAVDLPEKIGIVELLLKHGADPGLANSKGQTALFQAAEHANVEAVRMLVAAGGKPSGSVLTDLVYRCTPDSLKTMKLLLEASADVNDPDHRWSQVRRDALEFARASYKDKTELIDELSRRPRQGGEQEILERWKSEAQIFQTMIDALETGRGDAVRST